MSLESQHAVASQGGNEGKRTAAALANALEAMLDGVGDGETRLASFAATFVAPARPVSPTTDSRILPISSDVGIEGFGGDSPR